MIVTKLGGPIVVIRLGGSVIVIYTVRMDGGGTEVAVVVIIARRSAFVPWIEKRDCR